MTPNNSVSYVRCPLCGKRALEFCPNSVVARCLFCTSWMSAKNNQVYIIADNRSESLKAELEQYAESSN